MVTSGALEPVELMMRARQRRTPSPSASAPPSRLRRARSRVSTVTSAERPAIIGRPGSPSTAMRTGTRWRTLTQLPLAFCAGRTENCEPVPAPMRGDMAADVAARIGVDLDLGGLADIHVGEVGFLVIGLDIGGRAAHDGHHRHAGDHGGADLEPVGLADRAVGGRAHLGAGEVEQGLLAGDPRGLQRGLVGGAAAAQRRPGHWRRRRGRWRAARAPPGRRACASS